MSDENFKNLYKKMDATSKTRFHASRRLKIHSKCATYTVVIISLGLILISLMQAYSLGNNSSSNLVGLMQVFSSIAVLVYSLIIDKNNYSNLSEKMYSCACQLVELKQKTRPHLYITYDYEAYNSLSLEYHQMLKLYETHAINDFRGDYFRAKLEMPEYYETENKSNVLLKINIILAYTLNFISYPIVLGCLFWMVYWLWFG